MKATEEYIILDDGRRLGYAEYGDPQGRPLIYFHGWPSSRLEAWMAGPTALRQHIRIIAPDRPGFGLSDFKSGRKLTDWPDDVIDLADALELDRFAIMGLSGGGPYVAVCALKIPQRLSAAGIVSGTGPADVPGAAVGMKRFNRWMSRIGRWAPWLLRLYAWPVVRALKYHPDRYFARLFAGLPEPDRAVLARSEIRECLLNAGIEAFRNGSRGAAWENALYARSWGFGLRDISQELYLWHGELDINTPPAMGRTLATGIPNCRSRFYGDEGHISLFINHIDEILATLSS